MFDLQLSKPNLKKISKANMHVLFVLHRLHPNLREAASALIGTGNRCTFIVSAIGPSEPDFSTGKMVLDPSALTMTQVESLLLELNPDVIVQRNFTGGFLNFWKLGRFLGITTFLYNQDSHQVPIKDIFFRPGRVVRSSRDYARDRLRLGPHKRITPVLSWGKGGSAPWPHSIYIPFPMQDRSSPRIKASKIPTVVVVAKHGHKRKRQAWAVRALSELDHPFRLDLIGSTPLPSDRSACKTYAELRASAEKLGDRSCLVAFHEDLSEQEVHERYEAADLFVLPAKREMMAISPLEAMSHGLPVLVGADGGAAAYVRSAGSEQVFVSRSYRDFRAKLSRLLSDDDLRKRLAAAAAQQIKTTHSPSSFIENIGGICTKSKTQWTI